MTLIVTMMVVVVVAVTKTKIVVSVNDTRDRKKNDCEKGDKI